VAAKCTELTLRNLSSIGSLTNLLKPFTNITTLKVEQPKAQFMENVKLDLTKLDKLVNFEVEYATSLDQENFMSTGNTRDFTIPEGFDLRLAPQTKFSLHLAESSVDLYNILDVLRRKRTE